MFIDKSMRVAVFIDGANVHASAKAIGFDIDYSRLLSWLNTNCTLITARYYTAILDGEEYNSVRPLVDWLSYNGFVVVSKAAKEFTDSQGKRRIKGNMDGEISVDVMQMCLQSKRVNTVILFSGDGDFRYLVDAIQVLGVRVIVVSTMKSTPSMVADDLRRQVDAFVDLFDLKTDLERKPRDR